MKSLVLIAVLALAVAAITTADRVSYDGYKVLRIDVPDMASARRVSKLEEEGLYKFWSEIRVGGAVDVLVPPGDNLPARLHLGSMVLVEDVGALFAAEAEAIEARKAEHAASEARADFDLFNYHELDEIYAFFDALEAENDFVYLESIGSSYEGRDMRLLKICKGGCGNKKIMWIESGIHAREWIGPATTTYMINKLVQDVETGDEDLTEGLDWYFLPSVNPDGYAYTSTDDRLWRKTRRINPGQACVGTDANRNFGYQWNTGGSSPNSCSDTYHGGEPWTEVEIVNVRDRVNELGSDVVYFQDLHSYSQLIMYPWGWSATDGVNVVNPDAADMDSLAQNGYDAMRNTPGSVEYEVGPLAETIYVASGIAPDWSYGDVGIKYSYTIELRPKGSLGGGFVLPPDEIEPTGEEMYAFHRSAARDIMAELGI